MNIEEHVKYWLDGADEDLAMAESMFKSGHYVWCLFVGHLALEKGLKAGYVRATHQTPPKSHNLPYLADKAGFVLDPEVREFLYEVTDFNIEARYTDKKRRLHLLAGREFTSENLLRIKEFHKWVKSQMKA